MGFRILTYKDPYNLRKEKFWDEIRDYPHLCSSTSLSKGMEILYSTDIKSIISTIDFIVSIYFKPWVNNFEFYIKQYTELSEILKHEFDGKNTPFANAIKLNQHDLLNSIRILKELGIHSDDFKETGKLRNEHKLLVEILKVTENYDDGVFFNLPEKNTRDIKSSLLTALDMSINEIADDEQGNSYKKSRLLSIKNNIYEKEIKKIVVHGLHQFKPLMYPMFKEISDSGVEVIFLFNYLSEYKNIYETWINVYSILETNISFPAIKAPLPDRFNNMSKKIAMEYGLFTDGENISNNLPELNIYSFENILEFSNYIADAYEAGKRRNPDNPFDAMPEHFFAGKSELNDILKIYFPEQYGERHFLSYPIGRFFSEIYGLWNQSKTSLKFEYDSVKEILTSGILNGKDKTNLVGTFHRLSLYFKGVKTLSEAKARLQNLLDNINEINANFGSENEYSFLKKYGFHTIGSCEIEKLINLFEDLETLAKYIFEEDTDNELHFGAHYKKISEFLNLGLENLRMEEEKKLIYELSKKLFHASELEIKGTFDDLKSSIVFYLKQPKNIEEFGNIVRSLEHLEGGIWYSKNKNRDFTYHFGMMSDNKLQTPANRILPWPLSMEFFESVYAPSGYAYQLYITSLNEYSSFIRYQLFHGWYFNNCSIKLSYVKDTGEEEQNKPYYFFDLLGVKEIPAHQSITENLRIPLNTNLEFSSTPDFTAEKLDAQLFTLCPYRFFNEIILSGYNNSGFDNEYLCKLFYYQVHLLYNVWSKLELKTKEFYTENIDITLEGEIETTKKYFPFLNSTADYFDIKSRFKTYFYENCFDVQKVYVRKMDESFINIKKNFIYNKYADKDGRNKVAFLSNIEKNRVDISKISESINEHIASGEFYQINPDEWCAQCKSREYCLPVIDHRGQTPW